MTAFVSISTKYVYCEANCVSHRLAYIASLSTIDEFWSDETPSIIEDILYEDICNGTRGSGFSSP